MWRSAKRLFRVVAVLAAGLLAAGCGSSITSSIGSLPSRTATVSGRPSVTAQPPTHSVTTAASAAGSAAPGASSGTSLTWLWVLLGVVVLAGLIALIARSGRRRSAAAAGWRSRLIEAYAKGSALHDAMSVAEAPGGLAAADAAARWSDIQRRTDDLAQMLYALREEVRSTLLTAPGSLTRSPRCRLSALRWTPSGLPAAPVTSRPAWSAAVWPPSSPPCALAAPAQ